ncbi:MAG: alpha/beta hydrolase [Actinophytocola sp.]|nr:alpha/beta hydrolase [Actinophytocola sp.]
MTVPVTINSDEVAPDGDLTAPADARGVVVFAHGSGSSRFSPRNRAVARSLQDLRLATLLFDLLRPEEEIDQRSMQYRFDLELLTPRLISAVEQVRRHASTAGLPVGLFGASTGAAVALLVAARRPELVEAVVSRGGRPDMAGDELARVEAPTLLIVGERDEQVLALNQQADAALRNSEIRTIGQATHLFEEPGALEQVTEYAGEWFARYLKPD